MNQDHDEDAAREWVEVQEQDSPKPVVLATLFRTKATRELRPQPQRQGTVPALSASALRQLAIALDRLMSFHVDRGGQNPDMPELHRVEVDQAGQISAYVRSGRQEFRLGLDSNMWILKE